MKYGVKVLFGNGYRIYVTRPGCHVAPSMADETLCGTQLLSTLRLHNRSPCAPRGYM